MGAQVAGPARATTPALVLVMLVLSSAAVSSLGAADIDALLRFKSALANGLALSSWDASVQPCDSNRTFWVGVLCLNGSIWGLQIENVGIMGTIDVDALASLHSLRTISLMNNRFEGPLPDFKKLGKLKALYLSNNKFSGEIPDNAFESMGSLKRLFLANNEFMGKIPSSLTTLPKLTELKLEGNLFQGQIPNFQQRSLKTVNFASNELEGPIPVSLSKLSPSSFSGNKGLCGKPLDPCQPGAFPAAPPPPGTQTPGAPEEKIDIWKTLFLILVVAVLLVALAMALCLFCRKKHETEVERTPSSVSASYVGSVQQHDSLAAAGSSHVRRADHGKLIFIKDDIDKFDLQDLLRASAEVLGSGTFGASYKAVVLAQAVVVKRYRHMNNIGREEFHEHMSRIGRLSHPNLLPLVAYYYRKEEKLLVTEFMESGSLASHLHGKHSLEDQGLDWHTRLKIIKGVARGLAYLYSEIPIMIPHGHLKSSNVLLDESFEPLLSDYALRPVINAEHAHSLMIAYKSPEYMQQGRNTKKTDIWSFGILILETLTGRFPENYLIPSYNPNADLASWVNNMVKEKRTSEVFDKEMSGTKHSKSEMISLLKIGLSCCEDEAERRPDIHEVVEKIEQLREEDFDDEYVGSEGNAFSIRGNDDDFFSSMDR